MDEAERAQQRRSLPAEERLPLREEQHAEDERQANRVDRDGGDGKLLGVMVCLSAARDAEVGRHHREAGTDVDAREGSESESRDGRKREEAHLERDALGARVGGVRDGMRCDVVPAGD